MNVRGPRIPAFQPGIPPQVNLPAPAAQARITDRSEVYGQQVGWPSGEAKIYTTSKAWKAIDVYLSTTNQVPFNGVFTVRVYAVLPAGIRTLIATGRYGRFSQAVAAVAPPQGAAWVCAARAQASTFEVTLEFRTTPGVAPQQVAIALCASDEALTPPAWVGVLRLAANVDNALSTFGQVPSPELIMVQGAVNQGVAAARWLHVHDRGTAVLAGLPPAFCFALGSAPGQGGTWPMSFRGVSSRLDVVCSSTADVTTQVVDCTIQALVR